MTHDNAQPAPTENHRRLTSLIGMPVVILADGAQHGTVETAHVSAVDPRLIGVTVRGAGGFLSNGRRFLLRANRIRSIGPDALTVDQAQSLEANEDAERDLAAEAGDAAIGKKVLTAGGKTAGSVEDVIFDATTGAVYGYEVSGGVWHNFTHGRALITLPNVISIGPDVVVVRDRD